MEWFQSSPSFEAGRYRLLFYTASNLRSSNPHPALRLGATPTQHSYKSVANVPILTQL